MIKIKTYGYPEYKTKVSPNELIRTTYTFYTRLLNGVSKVEDAWIAKEVGIIDGLEVMIDEESFYRDKLDMRSNGMSFGEYPPNATAENIQLEVEQYDGYIKMYSCECILRMYTCKLHEYEFWKNELDLYDYWRILDLEEKHGL